MKIKISYEEHEMAAVTKLLLLIRKTLPATKAKFCNDDSQHIFKRLYVVTLQKK